MNKIALLNDDFRSTMRVAGKKYITNGVLALGTDTVVRLIEAVKEFDTFTEANDPYGEHDFGKIELDGESFFWKIDYYDLDLNEGSPDPADPTVTARVLTIMLADEY